MDYKTLKPETIQLVTHPGKKPVLQFTSKETCYRLPLDPLDIAMLSEDFSAETGKIIRKKYR